LSQAQTSSISVRQTRRAHTERLQLLKGEVAPSPSTKSKLEVPISHPQEADIWDILATARGKGKDKEKEKSSQSQSSWTAPPRKEKKLRLHATSHPQTTIKRIKLLVRLPPPTFSHPRQRPPVPKFGGSLGEYLSSYTTVGDKDLYDSAGVERFVQGEAAIHDRISTLRTSGRLLFASESTSEGVSRIGGRREGIPLNDPWSRIIDAVVVNGKIKKVDGKSVAAQIAGKIKVYWDTFAAREDRARLMEDKRLRAMAKSTVRLVVAEWKKVTFVSLSCPFFCLYHETDFLPAHPGAGEAKSGGRGSKGRPCAFGRDSGPKWSHTGDAACGFKQKRLFEA
jgi:helicase SWR1